MNGDALTPLQRAAVALQSMRARLDSLEAARLEPLAIVGMSCRFPGGAEDPESYWDLLRRGASAVTEVPRSRWDCDELFDSDAATPGKTYARHGAFLAQVDQFDAAFFGIAPREARALDPQQRLLLEVAWEALERAGYANETTRENRTGVFVGMTTEDYAQLTVRSGDLSHIDAYGVLGNGRSVAAGRIAYVLGLQGPVLQLDTTCSSSLVAVHLAAQSLRAGECGMALAAGVNLMLWPGGTIGFSQMNALSRDGRCRALDAGANGYVRGEGCGAVVLRRLSDSLRDRDNILAVLRGSAINHDGRTSGLTVPNGAAQEAVVREALSNAGLRPEQIGYVELHGTGTPLGDPIELQALDRAMPGRQAVHPLWIGSVKTNIGHLEAAAGMAGLIKAIQALQHGQIPPHLHFESPNPAIPWAELRVLVPRQLTHWPAGPEPRRAGVSAFGMSGTNAHAILEAAPLERPIAGQQTPWHLFCISARSEAALREFAARFAAHLEAKPDESLEDLCYTVNTGRAHFGCRLAAIADSIPALSEQLRDFCDGRISADVRYSECDPRPFPKFVFAGGRDSTAAAIDSDLYPCYAIFRDAAARLAELHPRPVIGSAGYALWQLWDSFGVIGPLTEDGPGDPAEGFTLPLDDAAASRKPLLRELARLHCHGVRIGWKAVHAGGSNRRLPLPVYPFERQRFWLEPVKAALSKTPTLLDSIADGDVQGASESLLRQEEFRGVDPSLLVRLLESLRRPAVSGIERHLYEEDWCLQATPGGVTGQELHAALEQRLEEFLNLPPKGGEANPALLEAACAGYAAIALRRLGAGFVLGERLNPAEFCASAGVLPGFDRLVRRLFAMLGEAGILAAEETDWIVIREPAPPGELPAGPEGELLDICGPRLADILRGNCDPLELLFPNGDVSRVAAIYTHSRAGTAMNRLAAATCSLLSQGRSGLRVLEIGAGTGSTTAEVLPKLAGHCAEYVFTDLSPSFFASARQQFASYSFLNFRTLDIERDPLTQGMAAEHFDLVVAANVLHATADLAAALDRVRRLLTPGGHLIVIEGTAPVGWLDLTFGLTSGWWKFSDRSLRPSHPLLSADGWRKLLRNGGFEEAEVTGAMEAGVLAGQALIAARKAQEQRHWLIFEGNARAGERLAAQMTRIGDTCATIGPGVGWEPEPRAAAGAIFFPALVGETVPSVAIRIAQDALSVVQRLLRLDPPPPLWIVTRGATALNQRGEEADLAQAALPGFCHACSAENRDFHVTHVDLEPSGCEQEAAWLLDEIRSARGEDRVAFHNGQRYVARLRRTTGAARRPFAVSSAGMYLVAGGLGGLGLLTAEWLAGKGARHIALVGRTLPSGETLQRLAALERADVRVYVRQADLASDASVQNAIEAVAGFGIPLRGVIHSAGVLDDAGLERQTPERFERVMGAKTTGAWCLHKYTLDQRLDFFILFSSVVSVLGSFGQSNHAAASSFLDGLAAFRRRRNLPALSINWSTWSGFGAAARIHADEQLKLRGVTPIEPAEGLEALDLLVRRNTTQVTVAPIDWLQFSKWMRPAPFLEQLAAPAPAVAQPTPVRARPDFRAPEAPTRRRRRLLAYLREELAAVLGFGSAADVNPEAGFFEQGMDSLTAVEFRERLQASLEIPIPATVAFDYPNLPQLATHILEQLHPAAPSHTGLTEAADPLALAEMPDGEAEALLLTKLESLSH
jgi:3-oxoacyl-(acyl-carrier-protein) synthase/SAM-dependent methyltransferase/acyl carrier protein